MDNMDNRHFIVSPYTARRSTPWKVQVRASFAGKKICRFCQSEAEAWTVGEELVAKIRAKGADGLTEKTGLSMRSACDTFITRQASKSRSHRDKVREICGMLSKRFPLVCVSPGDLDAWFCGLPGTETTRAMFFRYTRMFFRWAHRMRFVEHDPSAALDAPKASIGRNILTVEQMRSVLSVEMDNWTRACVLLGAFAGLRTEEMLRMDWSDIDTEAGEIHIRPGVMKDSGGFFERIVDFTEPLNRRKEAFSGTGKLVPVTSRRFHYARKALALALGWPIWPDNCLRHSFATYHLAMSHDPGKTAYQMGHSSPAMVRKVYAVPARRADGAAWWAL